MMPSGFDSRLASRHICPLRPLFVSPSSIVCGNSRDRRREELAASTSRSDPVIVMPSSFLEKALAINDECAAEAIADTAGLLLRPSRGRCEFENFIEFLADHQHLLQPHTEYLALNPCCQFGARARFDAEPRVQIAVKSRRHHDSELAKRL